MLHNHSVPPIEDTAELRKDRGAFFTPPALAQFIADWAIRAPDDRVIEPSCGDAVFLAAAGSRLRQLGSTAPTEQLQGHDIHLGSLQDAASMLSELDLSARLIQGDFFDAEPQRVFDAAIGNPPYIRFQGFTGENRAKSLARALSAGVNLSGLASSWAAFTVHTTSFLKTGGRLGLVLPAELLSVRYASPIRDFLLRNFVSIELVIFDELVFAGVQADVVILLADGFGQGPAGHFTVYQAKNAASLDKRVGRRWVPPANSSRWTDALLDVSATPILGEMQASGVFAPLREWGTISSGSVTGANRFFALSRSEADANDIDHSDLQRLLPPGLSLMAMERITAKGLDSAGVSARTRLFYPQEPLRPTALRYIEVGKRQGIPDRYKCRVRNPWWRVPITPVPDLFVSYMSGATPRMVANQAGALHLNSIHGLRALPDFRSLAMKALPLLSLSSYSLLSAEIEGRSYGGGVLKLEPREAAKWLVPSPDAAFLALELHETLLDVGAKLIKKGDLPGATEVADQILADLLQGVSARPIDSLAVRAARSGLLRRRITRGRTMGNVAT